MVIFSAAKTKFLSHLRNRALVSKGFSSPNTGITYAKCLLQAESFLYKGGVSDLEKVRCDHIQDFLLALRAKGLLPNTVRLHRTVLASFFQWATKNYKNIQDPTSSIAHVNVPRKEARHLTRQQTESLLAFLWKDRKAKKRDALLFELIVRSGARVSEVCSLDRTSIALTNDEIRIELVGKGNKPRSIVIPLPRQDEAWGPGVLRFGRSLQDHVLKRRRCTPGHETALFLTNYGNRIRPRNIQASFDYYRRRLNLDGLTPHSIRHSYASHLLQQGVDVATVSKLLGHASPHVTLNVYAHTDPAKLREGAAKAFL